MTVKVGNGKYCVVVMPDGSMHALRNGEPEIWLELSGDKLVYCLVTEVQRLRDLLEWVGPPPGYGGREWQQLIQDGEVDE